jgi:hypothetical protein
MPTYCSFGTIQTEGEARNAGATRLYRAWDFDDTARTIKAQCSMSPGVPDHRHGLWR